MTQIYPETIQWRLLKDEEPPENQDLLIFAVHAAPRVMIGTFDDWGVDGRMWYDGETFYIPAGPDADAWAYLPDGPDLERRD